MALAIRIVICVLAVEVLGVLNSFWVHRAFQDWYPALAKPPGTPPDAVFAPVWTVLYALMGVGLALVWNESRTERGRDRAIGWFVTQYALNLIWTPVFFGAKQMVYALFVLICLCIAVVFTIRTFAPVSKLAAWLLVPYLVWILYATYLNAGFIWLNW